MRAAACGVALAVMLAAACSGKNQAIPPPAFDRSQPHWEDAFDRVPDILVIAHPREMARDAVYGPLLKNLSRMVAARAPHTAGTRAAEVFESSEEVVFGLRERGAEDAIIVFRGVRADFDARKLVDENGRQMWGDMATRQNNAAIELVRDGVSPASLFLLPQRTWVVAVGAGARERARDAFAHPFHRPAPAKDNRALFLVRLDGPSLVRGVPRLRSRGGALEPVGRRLESLTLALRPGNEGVVATFAYSEEGAAAFAESVLKQTAEALDREGSDTLKWLGQTKVDREASTVVARVSLPARLLADLPAVSAAELGF